MLSKSPSWSGGSETLLPATCAWRGAIKGCSDHISRGFPDPVNVKTLPLKPTPELVDEDDDDDDDDDDDNVLCKE